MDPLVTLFGGGGFVGRYVAQALLRGGARVRVAQRDPRQAYFLKPLGGLGQTQFVRADIRDRGQVAAAAAGSDAVVNLVGILKGNFQQLHIDGAGHVAEAAAAAGAGALVQVSAIGADPAAPSAYARSKGLGEERVRAAFPDATIVRPSIVFGREDSFINRFAGLMRLLPVMPVIGGASRFQPVYAADVAQAVALAALHPERHGGRTYELGGPQVMTLREIQAWIGTAIHARAPLIDVPDAAAGMMARLTGWLPGAPITYDQWLMLRGDTIVAEGAPGLAEFGIAPTPLQAVADGWLTRFRDRGRFAAKSPY